MSRKPDMRSIETRRRTRRDGTALVTYRVRWTGPDGSRERRTFDDLDAAVAFRDELDRRASLIADGPAARATMTVGDCYEQWMRDHVRPQLAARTIRNYEGFWSRHLRERIGGMLAIDVRPRDVKALVGDLLADDVGAETTRKALQVLGHVFAHALELDIVDVNPVAQIRKPKAAKRRQVSIVDIETVERMRRIAIEVEGSPLAAIIISLGYLGGLRPGEWRALRWANVRQRSLTVVESTDLDGSLRGQTKTGVDRSIDTWTALDADLAVWRSLTPFREPGDPVIPTAAREHWDDETYKRWAQRAFRRIAVSAGWPGATPNKLRHVHASLLIKEGRLDLREIAERMGHSVEVLERRYSHEIREYRGRKIDIASEVEQARAAIGAHCFGLSGSSPKRR
ncbi:MAG TPA: tyrosine-type recombinase/integrase [Solirubrobacteraceae bacterium]|jgi:integrase